MKDEEGSFKNQKVLQDSKGAANIGEALKILGLSRESMTVLSVLHPGMVHPFLVADFKDPTETSHSLSGIGELE